MVEPDPTPEASPFSMPLRVRYIECDMQGRVYNAHYLTWVDMAHTEAIDQLFGGYREMVAAGVDLVVAAADLQFRAPAHFDDRLQVHTTIRAPGRTSLRSDFTITREETVLAEARMVHVCVDATSYEKQPWPDWLRAKLPGGA